MSASAGGSASTERLWIVEPKRKTCLATVKQVRGDRFRLDRSLFRPKTHTCRHPQRPDRGTVWVQGGNKHRLISVFEDRGKLWHRIASDRPPRVGDELQCHLDQHRREMDSRAHTAMHLLLAAAASMKDLPPIKGEIEVKGGGCFRLDLADPFVAPPRLAAWLERANQFVDQDKKVTWVHVPREHAERELDPQPFVDGDPFPGPETTITASRIEGICTYPCDGTHVERTSEVGRIQITEAHPDNAGGFVLVGKLARPHDNPHP